MKLIIDIPDKMYDAIKEHPWCYTEEVFCWIKNEKPFEEAEKKYETEVITRGNCMKCGKELTEGLFFCKECEEKANSRKENNDKIYIDVDGEKLKEFLKNDLNTGNPYGEENK